MKKLSILILGLLIITGFTFAQSITVTSPNGGESLTRGNNFSISWTSSGVTGNVNLILWKGSANLGQIAQNKPANGSYSWPVGDALVNPPGVTYPDGTDYKVMVKSIEDWTISDESNENFTISTPGPAASITVTSPNGGETIILGTDITWTSSGITGNVGIQLFQNGSSLGFIAENVPISNGTYKWIMTGIGGGIISAGSNYKIQVKSGLTGDLSDGNFTIESLLDGFGVPEPTKETDLVIDRIKRDPKHPVMGEVFTFSGVVSNMGNSSANASVAEIFIKGPNTNFSKRIPVRKLKGHSLPFNPVPDSTGFSKEFKFNKWGIYKFTVKLDVDSNVTESDENNNEKFILIDVNPAADLIVCISNNKRPRVAYKTQIHATVKNVGEFQSVPCKLRFYVEKKGTNEYDIPVLHPGKIHTITREERWSLAGTKTISAIIDYYKKAREFREDNNRAQSSYFVRLPHHKKTTHPPYSICSSKAFNIPW